MNQMPPCGAPWNVRRLSSPAVTCGSRREPEYMTEVQYFGTHPFDQISVVCGGRVRLGAQDVVTQVNKESWYYAPMPS
jgi:hypothetical protein